MVENNMDILGVRVDNFEKKEILEKIESFLREEKFHQIATVNPEFILTAQRDDEFKKILNSCDLNVADGVGLKFAFWRFGKNLKTRIAGADLADEILRITSINNYKIFLIANKSGLSSWEETRAAILRKHPNLEISGIKLNCHSERVKRVEESNEKELDPSTSLRCAQDDIINYDIVLCAFGAPDQEKFLHSLKTLKDSKIRLVMGVGGTFDFLTGEIQRAPKWLRNLGLEWVYRLMQEPKYRSRRIFRAVVIFPLKILINKK
jgi:N-acetylglucosaminyldiphosphoundecaprenol N-acetyl-beta-D-mannosaminyltransferase